MHVVSVGDPSHRSDQSCDGRSERLLSAGPDKHTLQEPPILTYDLYTPPTPGSSLLDLSPPSPHLHWLHPPSESPCYLTFDLLTPPSPGSTTQRHIYLYVSMAPPLGCRDCEPGKLDMTKPNLHPNSGGGSKRISRQAIRLHNAITFQDSVHGFTQVWTILSPCW